MSVMLNNENTVMHRVNKTLVKKYFAGDCIEKEITLVEEWLESGEYHDPLELSPKVKSAQKKEMSQTIAANIHQADTRIVPLCKRLMHYASVACVALGLILIGCFAVIKIPFTNSAVSSVLAKSQLHITSVKGKVTTIEGECFDVKFNGMIEVYNASETKITITCGNETFELEPLRSYFLKGSCDAATIIKSNSSIEYSLSRKLKGNFSIHLARA